MKQYIKILEETEENIRAYINCYTKHITICLEGKKQIKHKVSHCHFKVLQYLYLKKIDFIITKKSYTAEELVNELYPVDFRVNQATIRQFISKINKHYEIIKKKHGNPRKKQKTRYYLEV